jgi:hypothetical protein
LATFALTDVYAAAREGRVSTGGPNYRARLLPYVGNEWLKMVEFTEAVLLELVADDFMSTQTYEGVPHDEYGISISRNLQLRFGLLGLETWYVKFTIDENQVLMASLHAPTGPLDRAGGTIPVRFKRSST